MSQLNKRLFTSIILLVLLYVSLVNFVFFSILLIVINYLGLNELKYLFSKIFYKSKFKYFLSIFFSVVYFTLFSLIIWTFLLSFFDNNKYLFIFLLIICISTDTGGYLFGKLIGGMKITKISPNKTVSGVIGSFVLSLIFGLIYLNKFNEFVSLELNSISMIVIISFFSQFGDLIISYLKRKAKVKDTGSILPGHGGILDRIDGALLAIPVGIIIIQMN